MRCIVIEDDLVQQQLILNHINETETLTLVGCYTNSIDAIKELPVDNPELIFLDVEMPGMSGIEFLEKFNPKAQIILTTSKKKYALQAYDNDVTDYLLKPISYPRFLKAVNKAIKHSEKSNPEKDFLFIKSNGAKNKIMYNDILWIQSASEYIIIYTTKGKYMVYSSMNSILERLPHYFIRVHRSNIVSLNKIEKIHGNIIEIDGQFIKVSRGYKNSLKAKLGM